MATTTLIGVLLWITAYVCHADLADLVSEVDQSGSCGCAGAAREALGAITEVDNSDTLALETKRSLLTDDMIYLAGGATFMGTDKPLIIADGEGPLRTLTLSPYFLDRYSVTNQGLVIISLLT